MEESDGYEASYEYNVAMSIGFIIFRSLGYVNSF